MKYNILLFDLDGTLLDFDSSEKEALKMIFVKKGYEPKNGFLEIYSSVNKALWRSYENGEISMSTLLDTRFKKTMEHFGIEIDGAEWEREYREYLGQFPYIIDGAADVLKNLSENHRIFAITNGVGDTQTNRLKLAGIIDYFEDIFVSQLIGAQKPSNAFFEYVKNNIRNFDIKDSLVIGDSQATDILGGNNYGIDTCLLKSKDKKYDNSIKSTYEIYSLAELYKICD